MRAGYRHGGSPIASVHWQPADGDFSAFEKYRTVIMSIPFSLGFDRLVVVYSSDCCSGSMPSCRCCMLRTGGSAEAVVSYPGRLQLDHSPGGAVHLRHRQTEPVPQAPEPFAARPRDRLLQLPPTDKVSRAGGGARHGCRIRCGRAARVFIIWCRRLSVHCGLLGGWAGLRRAACLVAEAVELSGAEDRGWLHCRGRRRCSPRTIGHKIAHKKAHKNPPALR